MTIMSIQSFVSLGYVGNRAATFVLETLGFKVASIPTVIYSNHSGYGKFEGRVLQAEEILSIFNGIMRITTNNDFKGVITGYIGNKHQPKLINQMINRLLLSNPNCIYVCDPAIANERGLFVDKNIASSVFDYLIPISDIITPNQVELEFITGIKINNIDDAIKACEKLFSIGAKHVIATSIDLEDGYLKTVAFDGKDSFMIEVPRLSGPNNGAGDVFNAIICAHIINGKSFKSSVHLAVSVLYRIINLSMGSKDILLVEGKKEIVNLQTYGQLNKIN
ncbi:pyridoxal kinase [Alphaproteobacteria bacterium]|nr:pyridoxal kinase [Alphaproteobacteria bacterium]